MSDFQLPPIDFFAKPMSAEDAVIDRCIEAEFEGLAIAAPSQVNLSTRESLPVAGCTAATLRDAKLIPFDDTVIATAVCLESGTPYAALAVAPPEVAEPYEPSDRDPGEGTTYRMFLLNLRRRLGLPWKPGTYLITLLQRDRRSNRVRAELCQSSTFDDPEVRRLREEMFNKQPPPRVQPQPALQLEPTEDLPSPPVMLPTFQRIADSPVVPESSGVALQIERVVVTTPGARAVLAGSFSLPVLSHQVLSVERRAELEGTALEGATGVVSLAIVLSGSERPRPIVLRLGVPTFDPLESGQAGQATGHFALDLLSLPELRAMPSQTYFVHALASEVLSDATLMALVDPALLPGA